MRTIRLICAHATVLIALLCSVAGPAGPAHSDEPDVITVFAAASLTDALQALATDYREPGAGTTIRFSFAASSTLARQIEAGAPADIFISANPEWMDHLAAKSQIMPGTRVEPLGNTLVMIVPADSPIEAIAITKGINIPELVGTGNRIAAGDPAHVPAGLYAQKALVWLGIWEATAPLLARADSVRAALALVERGEAPLGIVYATDASASSRVRMVGAFPQESYPPITYPFAIVTGRDTPSVQRFFTKITSRPAAPVYERFGFVWRSPTG